MFLPLKVFAEKIKGIHIYKGHVVFNSQFIVIHEQSFKSDYLTMQK